MKKPNFLWLSYTFLALFLINSKVQAQTAEERFQDLFITAGYATAFGAALGAASLAFYEQPEIHLQHIAVGASLGFIGGSVLGGYLIFSPIIGDNNESTTPSLVDSGLLNGNDFRVGIRPVFDPKNQKLLSAEIGASLLQF